MKTIVFLALLLILCACRGEQKHVALVYELLKNPVKMDSICIAKGYGCDIRNKSSYIEFLTKHPNMKFSNIRIIEKGSGIDDLEWQVLQFKQDDTTGSVFYFKKTIESKWVLFEPEGIID